MRSRDRSGYTVIELILVIVIIAVMSLVLSSFIISAMNSWVFVRSRQSALSQGRSTAERIVREIRRIQKPSGILTANGSELEFVDVDSNSINFRQDGQNLMRNADQFTSGILTPEGLAFGYYDAALNPTAVNQNIRFIRVRLTLVRGNETVIIEDGARIRNL